MLKFGSRLRSYHSIPYLNALDTLQAYFSNPYFLQAKSKNYININNLQTLERDSLKQTMDILFSKENASNTLNALDRGCFTISQLVSAKPQIRNAYLDAFSKNQIEHFEGFERAMVSRKETACMDELISRFTR